MEKVKTYKVNEIFYSLQGEGCWTGHAAIFIRFAGCNLKCPFCDTEHEARFKFSLIEMLAALKCYDCKFLVLTGGEPTLQVDEVLVNYLHSQGYFIAMETNGTHKIPEGIDWVTVSPKDLFVKRGAVVVTKCDELKVVYDGIHTDFDYDIETDCKYIQPCDTGDAEKNREIVEQCIKFVKDNPSWQLSLQTQKILNVR